MALIAKQENEVNYAPTPEGVHVAICYSLVDLGVHYNELFKNHQHQIRLTWELPDEKFETEDGLKPRVIGKTYTFSLSEKANLRKDLTSWRGRAFTEKELVGFDIGNILKKGCQLQIVHRKSATGDKIYSNIVGIVGLPKGYKVAEPENTVVYFDMVDKNPVRIDRELVLLPEWMQKKIKESVTYKEIMTSQAQEKGSNDIEFGVPLGDELIGEDELPF